MLFDQEIAEAIWKDKYRFTKPDGSTEEYNREDTHRRVVDGIYALESDLSYKSEAYQAMVELKWCPAGRIHAGAGTGKRVTLLNCFVSPDIADSMDTDEEANPGIMDCLKVSALTQQMGGGIGMDFSTLRPKGAIVNRTGSVSDGPLKFMDMWDAMCETIMSSGSRRGAMMGTLADDHPDLPEFIKAKQEEGRLTNFNVSVLISDRFMKAVENGDIWELGFKIPRADTIHVGINENVKTGEKWYVYQEMPARELWDNIISNTYVHAEPGVIFIDKVNEWNNLHYCEYIHCTNPCGEQPLPPNADCDLGAINLAVMVKDSFTDWARVDYESIIKTTEIGVRFLDNVLEVTEFPTEDQKKEAMQKRRIGLGITGLANLFQQMKMRYGSKDSIQLTEMIMRTIRDTAYETSIKLSKERGAFLAYNSVEYQKGRFIKSLPNDIQDKIKLHGIRNGILLTIAPTGTTSIYYDNVSSGLEPTFSWAYGRKVKRADGGYDEYIVEDYGYRKFKESLQLNYDLNDLPDYMVTAQDLTVDDHLAIQQSCQSYVDASISKTINCPESMTYEEFKEVYAKAFRMNLKGCTTYRPDHRSFRGAVLTVSNNKTEEKKVEEKDYKKSRPEQLNGKTYKIRWPNIDAPFYLTFNWYEENGRKIPFEMFINSKSIVHAEWIAALTRLVSSVFRRGGNIKFLVEELEQVHSPGGGQFLNERYIPSLVAMIGATLARFLTDIGYLEKGEIIAPSPKPEEGLPVLKLPTTSTVIVNNMGEVCPQCNQPSLFYKEGCKTCQNCGYSTC